MYRIIAVILLLPVVSQAQQVSLTDYVSSYFSKDETLKIGHLQLEQGKNSFSAVDTRYSLDSTLSLYRKQTNYKFPGSTSYDLNSNVVDASINQTVKTGTMFSLSGQFDHSDHSEFDKNQRNFSYSLTISQPIYKNALGSMFYLERNYLKNKLESLKYQDQNNIISSCVQATLEYLDAYIMQEKVSVYESIQKNSQEVWAYIQKAYKRRLVNRISYLSAKTDWIDKKNRTLNYVNSLNGRLELLSKRVDISTGTNLESPIKALNELQTPPAQLESNKELLRLKASALAMNNYYRLLKNSNRSDISVYAQVGSSSTENDYSFSVAGDQESSFVIAGITATLPLIDKESSASVKNALIDKLVAEQNERKYKRELQISHANSIREYEYYRDLIGSLEDKVLAYEERAKLAYKKMKSGKLDLTDYISYRDQYSSERINLLDTYRELYNTKLNLLKSSATTPSYCEDL